MNLHWKIDGVPFETYGVSVSKAIGVLDRPKILVGNFNWLDEDGDDVNMYKAKKEDVEFTLECFIVTKDYDDFYNAAIAFYDMLRAPGLRQLECDYLDAVGVYSKEMVTLTRYTAWDAENGFGKFSLRLTIPGELKLAELEVYSEPLVLRETVLIDSSTKINRRLQTNDTLSLKCESNTMFSMRRGDYIQPDFNKMYATWDRYYLMEEPEINKMSKNKYVCQATFEHEFFVSKKIQFSDSSGRKDFYWHENAEGIMTRVVECLNAVYPSRFMLGGIVETVKKLHSFQGDSCYDVITNLCIAYEIEFDYSVGISGITITLDKKIGIASGMTFQYGKTNNLYDLFRRQEGGEDFCTRLFVEGSKQNLPTGYRSGHTRLQMPAPTGGKLESNIATYGVIEKTKFFDDIRPEKVGTVESYVYVPTATEQELKQFKIADTGLFDINQYLIDNMVAKVNFLDGDLAGYTFELKEYNHAIKTMFIKEFIDEVGNRFPSATLHPRVGDQYVLVDIHVPEEYVTDAEVRLQAAGQAYLDENNTPKYVYTCNIDKKYTIAQATKLEPGNMVTIIDSDFGINGLYRILEISHTVLDDSYYLTLTYKGVVTKTAETRLKSAQAQRAITAVGQDKSEYQLKSAEPTKSIKNQVFSPIDFKFEPENIRSESIDPRMLAYDSGVPQISIKGGIVKCNVDGDPNKVVFGSGNLLLHNYKENTKSRWDIKKLKDLLTEYNPVRIWNIPETTIILANSNEHWIYARVNMTPGSYECIISASEQHIEVKENVDDGYLKFKLGSVKMNDGNRIACMLWGNSEGGFYDAPFDGKTYGRKNRTWVEVPGGSYNWKLHSPEEITGYLTAPSGIAVDVDGTGAVVESVAAGQLKVTAINAQGETTPANIPAFDVLADSTEALVSWTPVTGVTGYRVYDTVSGDYKEITGEGFDYLTFVFDTAGTPPAENTAAILQTAFTIDNNDTVEITGENVMIETSVDPEDATKKRVHLTVVGAGEENVQSDWNQTDNTADDYIKNKPTIPTNTDEKVKFDATDPTAGYLSEKIVAGANVAITEGTGADENKVKVAVTGLATVATSGSYNDLTEKPTIPTLNANYLKEWQGWTFEDVVPGTAKTYVIHLKAKFGYTIDSIVLQTDAGTLTGCALKINGAAVTGLSSITITTTITETNATGANTVAAGDIVTFEITTGYTGSPTLVHGLINYTKN